MGEKERANRSNARPAKKGFFLREKAPYSQKKGAHKREKEDAHSFDERASGGGDLLLGILIRSVWTSLSTLKEGFSN